MARKNRKHKSKNKYRQTSKDSNKLKTIWNIKSNQYSRIKMIQHNNSEPVPMSGVTAQLLFEALKPIIGETPMLEQEKYNV